MQDICELFRQFEWPDASANGHQVRISVYRISNPVTMSYPQTGGRTGKPGSNFEPISGTGVVQGVNKCRQAWLGFEVLRIYEIRPIPLR